ncbi:MAG: hypothetical protein ACYDAI_19225 [Trichloromonadaceae bacterium]
MDIERLQEEELKPVRELVRAQRYTEGQWAEIEEAARLAGMVPGKFIRACVLTQVREILSKKRPGKVR